MKVFAHRGFSHKFPEATRSAYEGAIAINADGLECDIRLTRDLIPICFHDRNLKRIAGNTKSVSKLSLNELRELTDVMTLGELVKLASEHKKDLLIETKHPSIFRRTVEKKVLAEIDGRNNFTVMSFSLFAVLWLRKRIRSTGYVIGHRWRLLFLPTEIVAIDYQLFNKSKWVRRRLENKMVYLWTVNEISDVKFAGQVKGVITDKPNLPFRLS